jgi:hypothetical protein
MGMKLARISAITMAVAVAAGGATTSAAYAKATLKLQANGATLAPGAPLSAASANFEMVSISGAGKVVCQATALSGEVEKDGTSLSATMALRTAVFGGEAEEGRCTSTYASPLHHVDVEMVAGLPLRLTLGSTGAATLRPINAPGEYLEMLITPLEEHRKGEAASCRIDKTTWSGGKYHATGEALVVSFPPTKFHLQPNSGRDCGNKSNDMVSATFTFSSGGFPVDAVID